MSSKSRKGTRRSNGSNGVGARGDGALNIRVGTNESGDVAVAFDRAVTSFTLRPDAALNLARALAAGAKKAGEEKEELVKRLAAELGPEKLRELADEADRPAPAPAPETPPEAPPETPAETPSE